MVKGLWRHFLLGVALCSGPALYAQGISPSEARAQQLFNNHGTQLTSGLALTGSATSVRHPKAVTLAALTVGVPIFAAKAAVMAVPAKLRSVAGSRWAITVG